MLNLDLLINNINDNQISSTESLMLYNNELLDINEDLFFIEDMIDTYSKCIEIKSYIIENGIEGIDIFKQELYKYGIWLDNIDELNINLENIIIDTIKKVWDFIKQLIAKIINAVKLMFSNIGKIKKEKEKIFNKIKDKEIDYDKFNNTVVTAIPVDKAKEFIAIEGKLNEIYSKIIEALENANIVDEIKENVKQKLKSIIMSTDTKGLKFEQNIKEALIDAYNKLPKKWYSYLFSSIDKKDVPFKFKTLMSFEKRTIRELGYENAEPADIYKSLNRLFECMTIFQKYNEKFKYIGNNLFKMLYSEKISDVVMTITTENPSDTSGNVRLKLSIFVTRMAKNYLKLSKVYQDLIYSYFQILKALEKSVKE